MKKEEFVKGVKELINPVDVGTIHFIQSFNNFIPKKIQKKMVDKSGKQTPYMAFVVEPYSSFLFYEIKDLEKAKKLLPKGFRLIKTKIYEEDQEKYYAILGSFNAHTSGFWGMRTEFYVIAENIETGMLSWIIVDYDTNTITYDPKNILSNPNSNNSYVTVDYNGKVHVNIKNNEKRELTYSLNTKKGTMKTLDPRLWIEGNLSIAYGTKKSNGESGLFSLTFNPEEFDEAMRIPKEAFVLDSNNWYQDIIGKEPDEVLCFPYAQHFLSDSPGYSSLHKSEEELVENLNKINFKNIKTFSTKDFKKSFVIGGIVSIFTQLLLLLLLINAYR